MEADAPYIPGDYGLPERRTEPEGRRSFMYYFFSFSGRANRTDFWLIHILSVVFFAVCMGGMSLVENVFLPDENNFPLFFSVMIIPGLFFMLSSLAVRVRRFHDRGKSGWHIFIALIPYIGALWILIECGFLAGDKHKNAYGAVE